MYIVLAILLLQFSPNCTTNVFAGDASCSTNQDGLALFLTVPKTDFFCGEKIPATIIVSNMTTIERRLDWATGNPCSTGFGEFWIVETNSNRTISCQLPLEDRANFVSQSLDSLEGHQLRTFQKNLVYGYALTNAGNYSIQFTGRFWPSKSTDGGGILTTPPLMISVSSKSSGTNLIVFPH